MRAFYVVLAALAFFCETNTVSATGQTKLSKLVELEALARSEIGQGIGDTPRRLRDVETEEDGEDEDDDEDDGGGKDDEDQEGEDDEDEEERGYSPLWKSLVTQRYDAARVSGVISPNTLIKVRVTHQLMSAKQLKKVVNPALIVQMLKAKDVNLWSYLTQKVFPKLVRKGVTRLSFEKTLRADGVLPETTIKRFGNTFDVFRKNYKGYRGFPR